MSGWCHGMFYALEEHITPREFVAILRPDIIRRLANFPVGDKIADAARAELQRIANA